MFFHFVGATPGSTDLAFFLQRLVKEVNPSLVSWFLNLVYRSSSGSLARSMDAQQQRRKLGAQGGHGPPTFYQMMQNSPF